MTPRIEDIEKPIIGMYYLVPCIHVLPTRARHLGIDLYTPVISPLHDDDEYLNFPHDHWHFDFRFVSESAWKRFTYDKQWGHNRHHAQVLHQWKLIELKEDCQVVSVKPVYRRKKMKREMTEFPNHYKFLQRIEPAYSNCVLKDDLICPHKGVSLKGLPIRPDGNVVCPAHGLMWNLSTKKMVARENEAVKL